MSDDKAAAVRRAREVLNGAGWIFDQYRGDQMALMLSDSPQEKREAAYLRARIVSEIQAELLSVVESWDYDRALEAKREKAKEK